MNLAESLNNILQIIDTKCTDAGGDIHIDPARLGKFSEETAYLGERMDLPPFQAVLLAVIIQCQASRRCNINSVAKALGMSYLQFLSYSEHLYALRDKWLIRIKAGGDIAVPQDVISAIMHDTPYQRPRVEDLNARAIMRKIDSYLRLLSDGQLPAQIVLEEIDLLCSSNPDTSIGKAFRKYLVEGSIDRKERLLFYVVAHLSHSRNYSCFDMGDIEEFIKEEDWLEELRDNFDIGTLSLMEQGIIEPAAMEGLMARGSFTLKEEVSKEMFADIKRKELSFKTVELADCADKPTKKLFYNQQEKEQIERLSHLLEPDSLKRVFESMKEKGLRTGFTCLFYGDPGTGKTETVYQLARRTGRKILEADVASLRNCYVGETEKNVLHLFDDYRTSCEENELKPILLFNEADAILGTRMQGAVRSVDRMENSVQNILLQEMENFSGILIATTNLKANLDPAFERRFLYKLRFNKPEAEPRAKIWKSQFTTLSDDQAREMAEDFPLSGGQIENIVRKYTVDSVLSGQDGGYELLRQLCAEESAGTSSHNKIGFYIATSNGKKS